MSLTASEIEYGRLAIERRLATREQVRECAELRTAGRSDHLAKALVSRGYVPEQAARSLLAELSVRPPGGSGFGAPGGSGFGAPGGSGFGAPGSGFGAPGSGFGAPGGSGFGAPAPGYAPPTASHGPNGTHGYGQTAAYGPNGSHGHAPAAPYGPGGAPGYAPPTASHGPHGTHGYGPGGSHGFAGAAAPTGSGPALELPQNLAPDDPIAHAMSVRQNADGTTETVFGPYDILGEIARGGMGIVYRARQRSLKRIVALKIMKEGENASEKQIRRFKRETEAAAKLQHPNIVAVHEVGCHEGFHYFTMDLIEGDPLDAIVKRGEKLPVERVLQVVHETAQAIHYAHGKGIIHRDLKPANVMLDTDGHPKVTDFGLAKNVDHKSMLTRTGAVVGTPFYMPPEQARGDVDIDHRADVYALGVILYELLTLKLPFHGETTMEVYHKILEEEPLPPRKHDSRINADVETIILKSMDKDPARRYQTALELSEDIQRYLAGDPIKARPLGPIGLALKWAKKNSAMVGVGALSVAIMGLFLFGVVWKFRSDRAVEFEASRRQEWDFFTTEAGNELVKARSQIASGSARRKDRDPDGALVDLGEAVRLLDALPLLCGDFTQFNTREALEGYLVEKRPELAAVHREAYLEMGRALVDKGDPASLAEAIARLEKGLAHDDGAPDALSLRLEIGRVQALQGRHADALATFAAVLERDPEHVDARLETGRVHHLAGVWDQALAAYGQVIERATKPWRAHLLRGQTLAALGRHEEAFLDFDRVLEIKDDLFEGYVWRGRAHQALARWGDAQEDLTEAIDLNPSLPEGYHYRAELYAAQHKHAEAIKDYEVAISRSAQFYPAYLGLGRAYEWVLDYERARQQYDDVVAAAGRDAAAAAPAAYAALGRLLLAQADPLECELEVEERLRVAGASADGALGPPPPLAKLRAEAQALREARLREARTALSRALELDAKLVPGLLGRASLALVEGDAPAAKAPLLAALAALAERPHGAKAGGEQATDGAAEAADDDGEWEDRSGWGSAETEQAQGDPELAQVHALLGLVALREGKRQDARGAFQRAIEASGASTLAHAGLAHVALLQGDEARAREAFVKARRLAAEGRDEVGFFYQEGLRFVGLASRSKKPEYYKQARQCFARVALLDPLHALACLDRARLSTEWSAYGPAVALAEQTVEVDPTLYEGHELLGFLFARQLPVERDPATGRPEHLRDADRAVRHFDRAIEVAASPEVAAEARHGRALARLLEAEAAPDPGPALTRAREDLLAAIAWIPRTFKDADPRRISQSIAWLERLAEVEGRRGDEAAKAEALARVGAVRAEARKAAEEALKQGNALRDRLNYSDAIKQFDRAIELDPEFSAAFYERGTCYLKIGNFVPGILDFSRALELDPRIADQVYNKVYQISYVVDLNRVITELNKIVSDHPNVSYVVFLRGFFYVAKTEFKKFEREDLDRGIADFDRCLELNTTHVTALLYRGFLFYKMAALEQGEARQRCYDTALENYHHALRLDPVSGISHYLQSLLASVMSTEEGLSDEERAARRKHALDELKTSFECDFKGYERIKTEKGFDPIRNEPRFTELMRGK